MLEKLRIKCRKFTYTSHLPHIIASVIDFRIPWWLSGKNSPASAGDTGLIPGSGRFPGEVNGNLLQDSYLESPMDRGTRWATVYEVTKESHVPE